jgi:hypothetical protein
MTISRRDYLAAFAITLAITSCKTSNFAGSTRKDPALAPLESRTFVQASGVARTHTAKQGSKGSSANENYTVTARGVLDLLLVVDNSGSMAEEQQNLSAKLNPLLSAVKESDWQIAVTTTDPADRCVTSLIKKGDSNIDSRFRDAINLGTSGTGVERPILRAVEGLKCRVGWTRWLRDNSTVAVLLITDEDNCFAMPESGYYCASSADKNGTYLTDYLSSIRKIGTEARVYGLYWDPSQTQAQCPSALKAADILAGVVTTTKGTWGSICDADYGATLTRISSDVAQILKADFLLKSLPDPGTLKVMVGGVLWTDYIVVGNFVKFTKTPPKDSAIAVTYVSGASGVVTSEFELPSEPDTASLSATVGGVPAGPLSWDESKNKVVFQKLPAEGSAIIISYKEPAALRNQFQIAENANPTFIKVLVNGVEVKSSEYSYDAKTGSITFKVAPVEGAKIDISWRGSKKMG